MWLNFQILELCRKNTDFGQGFYTTTSFEQAEKWAIIQRERKNTSVGYVSVYEFDENLLVSSELRVYKFIEPTEQWLDFVVGNRRGSTTAFYDLVEGPVANDRLYATITLYEQGILSAKACIEQLQTHRLFNQLSFHSQQAIDKLRFIEYKEIKQK